MRRKQEARQGAQPKKGADAPLADEDQEEQKEQKKIPKRARRQVAMSRRPVSEAAPSSPSWTRECASGDGERSDRTAKGWGPNHGYQLMPIASRNNVGEYRMHAGPLLSVGRAGLIEDSVVSGLFHRHFLDPPRDSDESAGDGTCKKQ